MFAAAHPRQRGIAMLLVLIAVAVASILGMSFLSSQSTVIGMSSNVRDRTQARQIAESGLNSILTYMQENADWRSVMSNGVWVQDVALGGGAYTIVGEDGVDTNGDGIVDGDGDLADDASELVTLSAVGRFNGVSYRVRAVVTPGRGPVGPISVLMVVGNPESLSQGESDRIEIIESWGWSVGLIAAGATPTEFNDAIAAAHVVYVPDGASTSGVGTKLASCPLGVVIEDADLYSPMGIATGRGSQTGTAIRIVDASHYITSPFVIGELTIALASGRSDYPTSSVAGTLRQLAWWPGTEHRVVGAVEAGKTLRDGTSAAGRRVVSPLGGFAIDHLNDDGKLLLKRMLEWSGQSAQLNDAVAPLGNWAIGTTINKPNGEDRLLLVTVGAETHASITTLTYGNQPLSLAASAYESTGVGARNYVYYLREASIKLATDNRLRTTWTGTRDSEHYASRFYQKVSQTDPIRVADTRTNAGPVTISSAALPVSNGDMVVATAQTGNPQNYTWASPLTEGVDDRGGTSGHGTADYAVVNEPGTVTAAATTVGPNRQALVAAVLQPRAKSTGEGIIPQLLALYEFDEQQPIAELVGHWPLDDDGTGGALVIADTILMDDTSLLDGYHGGSGAYSGANTRKPVTLITNTATTSGIDLWDSAQLFGTTYNRPGANPSSVVRLRNTASISGNRYEQSVAFTMPTVAAPASMPATEVAKTYGAGSHTINSDRRFEDLTINTGATVTIQGNVRIQVNDDFIMSGGSIVVPTGATLELYVGDKFELRGASRINDAPTAPSRLRVVQYNAGDDLDLYDTSVICGTLYVSRDLRLFGSAQVYGSFYVGDDVIMTNSSQLHVDLSQPAFHIVPLAEATDRNPAQGHGGVTFDQAGARSGTNTAVGFDGSNDFVVIPQHSDYLLNNATISFWFYSESLTGTRALLSKDSTGYDTGGHLHIYTNGTDLKARIQSDGNSPYGTGNDFEVTATGMTINTWRHVAVTLGAGGLRLYVNGTLVQSVAYPGALGPNSGGIGNFQPLVLGAGTASSGDLTHLPLSEYFRGRIDDVRIYREVLDAPQVRRLYLGQDIGDRSEPSYVVKDTSGLGTDLDLTIQDTNAVAWLPGGGLRITQTNILRASDRPAKVRNGITATNEFTIEAIAQPSGVSGNQRLFWYGFKTGNDTNLDVSQSGAVFQSRVRTSETAASPTAVATEPVLTTDREQHLLVTFDGENLRLYRDGAMLVEQAWPGHLLTWDAAYGMALANHPAGGSPWLGTLKRVAVYDRALNQQQVNNVVEGLPPGDGASSGPSGISYVWREME